MIELCKAHVTDHLKKGFSTLIVYLSSVLIIMSCIYVPLPPHSIRSAHGVIPEEVYKSIKLEETTRGDLVLLIGGPDQVYEGERYFIYHWEVSEGVAGGPRGAHKDVYVTHYFCVEFYKGNRIKRFKHIESGLIDRIYKDGGEASAEMIKWMSDSH